MKRRKLVLAAMIAAMAVPSLSALAYDGDILTITADSDGDPLPGIPPLTSLQL